MNEWQKKEPKHLVVGYKGEVGSAIFKILKKVDWGVWGLDIESAEGNYDTNEKVDFIHICFPYSIDFVQQVKDYISQNASENTQVIIHSTVKPFTTVHLTKYHQRMGYSPVRGVHPLLQDLLRYPKFYASLDFNNVKIVNKMFAKVGIKCVPCSDPTTLEFAKLINTTYYGMLIGITQDVLLMVERFKLDSTTIYDFVKSTGDRTLMPYAQKIGGHCVVPNAEILEDFGSVTAEYLQIIDAEFFGMFGEQKVTFENFKEEGIYNREGDKQ